MSAIFPGFYIILLAGAVLLGLVLLATGIVLLIKLKNKLVGGLTTALGLIFTAAPIFVFMALTVIPVMHSLD